MFFCSQIFINALKFYQKSLNQLNIILINNKQPFVQFERESYLNFFTSFWKIIANDDDCAINSNYEYIYCLK